MYDVIILEDNLQELHQLKKIVEGIDSQLKIFATQLAQEALEVAEIEDIKLFILDIQLPDFSGIDFARKIREIDRYKLTNIVFITTVSDNDFTVFRELHCYDYILKPFDEGYVSEILGNIIKHGINMLDDSFFIIESKSFKFRIKEDDIYYIERINRRVHIYVTDKDHTLSNISLKKVLSELPNYFVQCRKNIIVNIRKIDYVDFDENIIYLSGIDTQLPVGDKYKGKLSEKLC